MLHNSEMLLRMAVDGDEQALGELLVRCAPALRRRLIGCIPARWQSILTIDDVLQQAFAEAIVSIRGLELRGPNAFLGWLTCIARCTLLDAIKMLEARKRGGGALGSGNGGGSWGASLAELAMVWSTPSRSVSRRESRVALREAVDRLPDAQRSVVEMYDLAGKPVEEVAAA